MSQRPRSRPESTESAPAPAVAAAPAPSNAPTILLLILVVGMMGFIAWWAFLGKGARAKTNAVLPPPPRLDAVPARPKASPKPVLTATPSVAPRALRSSDGGSSERDVPAPDDAAVAASSTRFHARVEGAAPNASASVPNEAAPSISEVPAPVASPALKQKAAKGGAVSSGPD